jgi:hypothetical protein
VRRSARERDAMRWFGVRRKRDLSNPSFSYVRGRERRERVSESESEEIRMRESYPKLETGESLI